MYEATSFWYLHKIVIWRRSPQYHQFVHYFFVYIRHAVEYQHKTLCNEVWYPICAWQWPQKPFIPNPGPNDYRGYYVHRYCVVSSPGKQLGLECSVTVVIGNCSNAIAMVTLRCTCRSWSLCSYYTDRALPNTDFYVSIIITFLVSIFCMCEGPASILFSSLNTC